MARRRRPGGVIDEEFARSALDDTADLRVAAPPVAGAATLSTLVAPGETAAINPATAEGAAPSPSAAMAAVDGEPPAAPGASGTSASSALAPGGAGTSPIGMALFTSGSGGFRRGIAETEIARAALREEGERQAKPKPPKLPARGSRIRGARAMPRVPFGPPKVPWIKPEKFLSGDPPGGDHELPYFSALPFPVPLEARIENAVWTFVDKVEDGIDVGVGVQSVWVLRQDGSVWQVDVTTARPGALGMSDKGTKITASHNPSGFTSSWTLTSYGAFFRKYESEWFKVPSNEVLVDICADEFSPPSPKDKVVLDVFVVGQMGGIRALSAEYGKYVWAPVSMGSSPYAQQKAVRIALTRKSLGQSSGPSDVWFIRDDDQVANLADPENGLGPGLYGAWDLGAGGNGAGRVVWSVGAFESPDLGAKGNVLWRMDYDHAPGHWRRISPGWGVAVDVDADGNPWVLDSDRRLWVRGLRTLGVAYDIRTAPKPNQTWTDYVAQAGVLFDEALVEARKVGAGGTIRLFGWDEALGLTAEKLLEPDPGFDVLFCIAPIFTTRQRVPGSLLAAANAGQTVTLPNGELTTIVDWANPLLIAFYLLKVAQVAAIPGFQERVRYFSMGNEVDVYFDALPTALRAAQIEKYRVFCETVAKQIKSANLMPNAKLGVCWRYQAIKGSAVYDWKEMNKECDVLIATYYARDQNFQPVDSSVYTQDFPGKVLELAKAENKPVVLQEVGMPTPGLYDTQTKLETLKLLQLSLQLKEQAAFLDYLFQQWQLAGGLIRFLSWWPLYDYFYDPELQVSLTNPTDPESEIEVVSGPTGPQAWTKGLPVYAWGNLLAPYFFGPNRPGKPPEELTPTNADIVYFLQQSVGTGKYATFCQFLSSCGLLRADGTTKPAWDTYRAWADKLLVQKVP